MADDDKRPDVPVPPAQWAVIQAADALKRDWANQGNQACQEYTRYPPTPKVYLSEAEQDIVDVIREAGGFLHSQKAILDALAAKGKVVSEGTTKVVLAALVRHGILKAGPAHKGYTSP